MGKRAASSPLSMGRDDENKGYSNIGTPKRHKESKYDRKGSMTLEASVPKVSGIDNDTPVITSSPFHFVNYDINTVMTPTHPQHFGNVSSSDKMRDGRQGDAFRAPIPFPDPTGHSSSNITSVTTENNKLKDDDNDNDNDDSAQLSLAKSVWLNLCEKTYQLISKSTITNNKKSDSQDGNGLTSKKLSQSSSSASEDEEEDQTPRTVGRDRSTVVTLSHPLSMVNAQKEQDLESGYLDFLDIYGDDNTQLSEMDTRGRTMSRDPPTSGKRAHTPVGRFTRAEEDLLKDLENCEPHIVPDFSPAKFDATSSIYEPVADDHAKRVDRNNNVGGVGGNDDDDEIQVINECDNQQSILTRNSRATSQLNINTEYIKTNFVVEKDGLERKESKRKFVSIRKTLQKVKENWNGTIRDAFNYIRASNENKKGDLDGDSRSSTNRFVTSKNGAESRNGNGNCNGDGTRLSRGDFDFGFSSRSQRYNDVVLIKNKKGEIRKIDTICSRILLVENEPTKTLFFPNGTIMEDFFKDILIYRIKRGKVKTFEIHNRQYITIEINND